MKRLLIGLILCSALRALADETEIEELRAQINGLAEAQRNRDALPYIGQLLDLRRSYRGEEHAEVARACLSFALTYGQLHQPEVAEPWFKRALEMLERVAPDTEQLAYGLSQYGWFLQGQKQLERAEPLLARTLAMREKVLGESDPETAWSVRNLAWVARLKGELPRAIALFERCDGLREKVRGPDHVETLDNLRDLADTCLLAGDAARGLALLREAALRQERAAGAESPLLAVRLTRLGEALRDAKELPEAEQVFRRLLAIRQKLGVDADTAAAWELVSGVQDHAKAYEAAIATRLEALRLREKEPEKNARSIGTLMLALAQLEGLTGHPEEAVAYFDRYVGALLRIAGPKQEATRAALRTASKFFINVNPHAIAVTGYGKVLEICRSELGEEHAETLQAMHELAWPLHLTGRYDEEEQLLKHVLELRRKLAGERDPAALEELRTLGIFYMNRRRTADFLATERQVVALGEKVAGADNERSFNDRGLLATALGQAGERREAAQVRMALLEDRRRHPTTEAGLLAAVKSAAEALETADAQNEAIPLREEELRLVSKLGPENTALHLEAIGHLADCQEGLKQWEKSEPLRQEALALAETKFGPKSEPAHQQATGLAWLYLRWRRYDAAETLLRRVAGETEEAFGRVNSKTGWALRNLGIGLKERGDLHGARTALEQALAIVQQVDPPETDGTLRIEASLADVLEGLKLYVDAEPLRRSVLEMRERKLGPDHPDVLADRRTLGWLYRKSEHFAEAEKLYRDAADATIRTLGPEHPSSIGALDDLGDLYKDWRHFPQATEMYERVLALRQKVLGPADSKTLSTMDDLAETRRELREFAPAEALLRSALDLTEKTFGADSDATAKAINRVASLLTKLDRWEEADALYRRVLALREKTDGADSPQAASSCTDLAWCAKHHLDYATAEKFYQRAYEIRTAKLGPLHEDTITAIGNLAELYEATPDYARSIATRQQELAALTEVYGEKHPKIVDCLNSLGGVYYVTGRMKEAAATFAKSLALSEQVCGPDHTTTAACATWLGNTLTMVGDLAGAEASLQRALRIVQHCFGAESDKTTGSLGSLAMLYVQIGNYERTEALGEKALGILEKQEGAEGQDLAVPLVLIAIAEFGRSATDAAVDHLERALRIIEKSFGGNHPFASVALRSLGVCYFKQDRPAEAEQALRRSMAPTDAGFGPASADGAGDRIFLALVLFAKGDQAGGLALAREASQIIDRVIGPDSNLATIASRVQAMLELTAGQGDGAKEAARHSSAASEQMLANLLSFGNEAQRFAFEARFGPFDLLASVGDTQRLAEAVLREKGIVLDSVLEDRQVARRAQGAGAQALLASMRANKQRIFQLLMEVPQGATPQVLEQRLEQRKALLAQVENQESDLARRAVALGRTRRALHVTTAEVQAALAPETALIEYVRCELWMDGRVQPAYGAVVLTRTGEPRWVRLGPAEEIEKAVRLFQLSARRRTDSTTLARSLRSLYDSVWAPLATGLPPGIKSLVISPDGELNFVSFATLLDPGEHFLAENYSVRYAASGRDLLRETPSSPQKTLAIYANPAFDRNAPAVALSGAALLATAETRAFDGRNLAALPGTAREASELSALAAQQGWHPQTSLGTDATEASLVSQKAPRILHLATHGFFLPELPHPSALEGLVASLSPGGTGAGGVQNPMHRSGLALAGAQSTLEAWARGEVPPPGDDGILTADEVGSLNLDGVWLVTLSACETGSGEARSGEGVLGLRRGFIQAGAENLLMTLWPISDETTVQIVLDFYTHAFQTGNAPQSLADVQRDWLVKLRKEKGLVEAVNLAGPFVMSSQGKPGTAALTPVR